MQLICRNDKIKWQFAGMRSLDISCRLHTAKSGLALSIVRSKRPGDANPGAALKALRHEKGWTLAGVAEKTELPISTLSRLENGKMAMTYEKLVQICTGLEIDMNLLIGATAAPPVPIQGGFRRSIARAGDGQSVATPTGSYLYVAADLLNKIVTPIIGDVTARSIDEYDEFLHHKGEEYLFVLHGSLWLYTEAYAPVCLEQGDSIYFDSSMGHAYVTASAEPCQVLSICATGGAEMLDHHHGPATTDSASVTALAQGTRRTERKRRAQPAPRARGVARKG
jgi:transcriptional regulator with XRE-family HTH domain